MFRAQIPLLMFAISVGTGYARGEPLAEKHLLERRLAAGETALQTHLAANPRDDQAQFGLGIVQF